MVVYLDLLMLLNFLVDYLMLVCAERAAGFYPAWGRIAWASVLGAIYGGVCLLPGVSGLGGGVWHILVLILMAVIAFGIEKTSLRRGVFFVLMTMALGGAANGLQTGRFGNLLGTAVCVAGLTILGFRGKTENAKYFPVELEFNGKTVRMTALCDTGNTLRDPVTGESVLVVGADVGEKFFGLSREQLNHPVETMVNPPLAGLHLIPYCAVGTQGGMLLAVRCERVCINGRQKRRMVAVSGEEVGCGDVYQALAGGDC